MSREHEKDGAAVTSSSEILDDLIDVSSMNFDNPETWLLDITSGLKGMDNLHIWSTTSSDTEKMYNDSMNDCKKFIDTRTWTRPKKKFNRLSFESIIEGNSSNSLINSENKCFNKETSRIEINLNEKTSSIPSILRPSILGSCSLAPTSGQESLEAFLNMSQTKGVDSFINMEAPEFNENLVGNSTSFCSNSFSMYDDTQAINQSSGMVDSQILTESMMQTSMFNDVSDLNINDAFARDLSNNSIIENPNYVKSLNNTIVKTPKSPLKQINSTFTTEELNQALDSRSFVINNAAFDSSTAEVNHLSYIIINENDHEDYGENLIAIEETEEKNLNSTFDTDGFFNNELEEKPTDSTFITNKDEEISTKSLNSTVQISRDNSTYKNDNTKSHIEVTCDDDIENKCLNSTFTSNVQSNRRKTFKIEQEDLETRNEPVIPMANRFQTYRKNTTVNRLKNSTILTTVSKDPEENFDTEKQVKSCENLLDIRKTCQVSKKLESNRTLSRLPQHLQKSNPNLISNSSKVTSSKIISNFGFVRPKQVKNNEPSLTRKVYSLAKLKNGSDQRLAGPKVDLGFPKSGGSTESIESTQSAASAPDLDDRLSVCSDGSNSCKSGVNMEEINGIKIGPESLQNTIEAQRILNKTWYSNDNDLPSPIHKDTECFESRGSSPKSVDSILKTSSPILSSAESLQSINNLTINYTEVKTTKIQPESLPETKVLIAEKPKNKEMKSGIRPPSARGLSGIPRPASRIPAPRFSRPSSNKI